MPVSRRSLLIAVLALAQAMPAFAAARFCSRTDASLAFTGPTGIAVADFYALDGIPDIAVTFGTGKRVVIYRNDGTGVFTSTDVLAPPLAPDNSIESLVADKPTNIIAEDFDEDGWPDIVGGNEGIQRFFSYTNPAGGAWGTPADLDARYGNGFDLVPADWNGDRAFDLVFAYPGRVGIALGEVDGALNPTGSWRDVARFTATGWAAGTFTDVEVDEFISRSGEVVPDVLTVDYTNFQICVWPGDPAFDGTVLSLNSEVVRFPTRTGGTNLAPFEAIKGDWNADGLVDVLVVTTEGYLLYYQGAPNPLIFSAPVVTDLLGGLAAAAAPRPKSALTAASYLDVTGDGIGDLVLADAGDATQDQGFNWLTVVVGQSQSPSPSFTDAFGQITQWHYAAADLDKQRPGSMAVFDVDQDVDPDVVLLNTDARSLTVWKNDGTGHFDGAPSFPAGGPQPRGCAASDLDGDGAGDVVVPLFASSDVAVRTPVVLAGDGAGGLGRANLLGIPGATGAHAAILDRFDADANTDLIVTYSAEQYLWRGNGNGTFQSPEPLGCGAGEPRTAELSGSAAVDLAIADRFNNRVGIWEGQGDGTFVQRQSVPSVFGYRDHVVGDFFAGSKDDIIVAGATEFSVPGIYIIRYDDTGSMHGTPEFRDMTTLGLSPFDDFARLAAGDFDGDGALDMAAVTTGGDAFLFRNQGGTDIQIDPTILIPVGGTPQSVLAQDLTLDGTADLAVATSSKVTVIEGVPGLGFTSSISLASNISNDALAAVDLDGDLRPELIVVSQRTADVTVFCNLSSAPLLLRLGRPGGHDLLSWTDAGVGATYDLARGDLRLLWLNRDLGDGTCLVQNVATATYTDSAPVPPRTVPPPQFAGLSCWWYLVKCQGGGCVSPDFGVDSSGAARFGGVAPPDPCP